jgi:hypothetical protein
MNSTTPHVLQQMPMGQQVTLDMNDPAVFEFVSKSYDRAGLGHERCPGLHRKLREAHESAERLIAPEPSAAALALQDDGWRTGAQVSAIGKTTAGDAASTGIVTFVENVATCFSLQQVLSVDNPDDVLAAGTKNGFGTVGTLQLVTAAANAKPLPDNVIVNILFTYQQRVGEPLTTVSYQVPYSQLAQLNAPTVTQPITTAPHAGNAMIKIGLGRGPIGQKKDDVDYWFWQGTSDTTYAVPFVGNVAFTTNIATPLTVGTNFFPRFALTRMDGGFKLLAGADLDNAIAGFSVSGATLSWNLPANTDPATSKPILFGRLNWQVQSNVYFDAQFPVTLTNGTLGYAAVVSNDQQPLTTQGITYIKPIWFMYHCVAPGTLVILHDGSTLPIEQITGAHSVRIDASGASMAVTANTVAPHKGKAYRMTTKNGRALVMSHGHLVITPLGPVAAQDLYQGEQILAVDGHDEISDLVSFDYDGLLYNLGVGDPNAENGNTLYANGILIGDMRMQGNHRRTQSRSVKVLLSKIDPVFHEDCLNDLALST